MFIDGYLKLTHHIVQFDSPLSHQHRHLPHSGTSIHTTIAIIGTLTLYLVGPRSSQSHTLGHNIPQLLVIVLHDLTWHLSHTRFCAWIIEVILNLSPGRDKDQMRFEAHFTPSRGHTAGVQKWYLCANHHVEAAWWAQTIAKSIQCARGEEPPPHEPASASRMSWESEMGLSALKLKSFRTSFQSMVRVGFRAPLWVWVTVDEHDGPPSRRAKAVSPPQQCITTTRMTIIHLQFPCSSIPHTSHVRPPRTRLQGRWSSQTSSYPASPSRQTRSQ